ncbi:PREDICTED: mRNA-decapping enzyme 1B isoform X2 [Gekko japonicus]|uniref:5'-(N(7)-methylguanosine 5'-triphospho)-[mRNA] hydrolase n=1 Tax=Gekko japonicus TaxID=146911 RepID=A0ABM1KXC3_GEKJA|nr:PREDICTED: mRNA-decapping enzyme 1B isoform X2 [Gekko japonicus]
MAAVVAGAAPLGKGLDISLAALQRHDPYISGILDVASQVALYTFGHRANEWEKTDVEGTLFVYTRSASPKYGFTIMNRLSMENRTEPITKDLDFQLQDPFLLYRNARLSIYGIWFYDKEECQRIAELMKNLTQQEQLKAQQGTGIGISPVSLNLGESKEVDILRMLTKAKDEYTKCKTCSEPKQITSSSAIYDNPNLIKPIPVKPSDTQHQCLPQQVQNIDPEPQHLSLTTLFGKQEKPNTYQDASEHSQKQYQENFPLRQGVVRSLSYEEPSRHSPTAEKQLCPAIQKLMVRGAELHPVSELPESRQCENGNPHAAGEAFTGLFQPMASHSIRTSHPVQDPSCTRSLLQHLQGQSGQMTKMDATPASSAASIFSSAPVATSAAQVISPQRIPSTVTPSLLMSPMVFTQSAPAPPKPSESGWLPIGNQESASTSTNRLLPMQNPEPSVASNTPLTKLQLQETLLHLIQNDENFLNIIYDAYLGRVRKAALKKPM